MLQYAVKISNIIFFHYKLIEKLFISITKINLKNEKIL